MDEGFTDPVVRCDSCQALIKRETIHQFGSCNKCGNRRIRNLTVFDEVEKKQMEDWGFGAFTAEFGAIDE